MYSSDVATIVRLSMSGSLKCNWRQLLHVKLWIISSYISASDDCFHISGDSFFSNKTLPSSVEDPKMTSLTELRNGKLDISAAHWS